MESLQSLADMENEILWEAQATGDPNVKTLVDTWLNLEAARLVEQYDFPELMTKWRLILPITNPSPQTWEPYELTAVPRDICRIISARILDTSVTPSNFYPLRVLKALEFERVMGQVNPPGSANPSVITIFRREGALEETFDPTLGDTGFSFQSSAVEAAGLKVGVTYYTDKNRTNVPGKIEQNNVSNTLVVNDVGTHFGVVSISKAATSVGIINVGNKAGTVIYATIAPWERTAGYPVIAMDSVPNKPTSNPAISYLELHLRYKRYPQYLSQASDTLMPLPRMAVEVIVSRVKLRAMKLRDDIDLSAQIEEATALTRAMQRSLKSRTEDEPHVTVTY